ncbi:MAG: cupin domain-containing protein [Nitrospinales bacterium]
MSDESDLEKARPVCLRDHIQYAAGAVVSKTLVNRKTGTITLFAFDAGQGLSEHTAPFDAIVQILDGEAELTIGGKIVNVSAGQMVVMPANIPHAVKAIQKFKMLLTMIRS